MCAIGKEGLIAHECVRGSYNAERFLNFINRYLVPYFRTHQTSVLIMDNARFHKTADAQETLCKNGIEFKFTVPYSPQLNTIEEFFHVKG